MPMMTLRLTGAWRFDTALLNLRRVCDARDERKHNEDADVGDKRKHEEAAHAVRDAEAWWRG